MIEWLPETGSALFAGGSVAWGIYAYQKGRSSDMVQRVRLSLTDVRHKVKELDSVTSFENFSLIVESIVQAIKTELEKYSDGNAVRQFFEDEANKPFILHSIFIGYGRSGIPRRYEALRDGLRRSVFEFKSLFPYTSDLISVLIEMMIRTGEACFRPDFFLRVFDEETKQSVTDQLFESQAEDGRPQNSLLWSKLKILLMQPSIIALEHGQIVFNQAEAILSVIVDRIVRSDDVTIMKLSKMDRGAFPSGTIINETTFTGDLIKLSDGLRDIFSSDEWTKIVKARTIIEQQYKKPA